MTNAGAFVGPASAVSNSGLMADQRLRPDAETFSYAGCEVTLVDPVEVLDAARTGRVALLHGAQFPPPVRRVRLSVAGGVRDGRPVHLFDAEITTGTDAGPILGISGPIGVLLGRRVAAGDPLATRIADGVGTVVGRLGLGGPVAAPPGPAVREDPEVGLRATVTLDEDAAGRLTRVAAAVPSDTVVPAHLAAMVRIVLSVVVDHAGSLAGRAYVVRRPGLDDEEVSLDQVGGLGEVVAQFRQIAVSFRHPQAMARWGARRPQGILMYGPPGTGKTMLARALANEIGANFREIRTPEILDKWLGGSERNIKEIFRQARRYREPTVMLFDEFDSIISYAGEGGDAASQAVNAVAGIFKQEMNDLIEENPNVLVVATTNFPHRVDDSLIRSGRFDVKISVPKPDEPSRAEIFRKMIRGLIVAHETPGFRMFDEHLDLAELARASHGMTGADIKEVLRRVQLAKAMQDARTGGQVTPISQADLTASIAELRP